MSVSTPPRPNEQETVTLSVTLPADQMPAAGSAVEVRLDNGLIARIENRATTSRARTADEVDRIPRTLRYAAVVTAARAAEEVHAAIARRVNNRNKIERFTLCDRQGKRVVTGLRHEPLTAVTCKQCRKQLIEDGVLDAVTDDE